MGVPGHLGTVTQPGHQVGDHQIRGWESGKKLGLGWGGTRRATRVQSEGVRTPSRGMGEPKGPDYSWRGSSPRSCLQVTVGSGLPTARQRRFTLPPSFTATGEEMFTIRAGTGDRRELRGEGAFPDLSPTDSDPRSRPGPPLPDPHPRSLLSSIRPRGTGSGLSLSPMGVDPSPHTRLQTPHLFPQAPVSRLPPSSLRTGSNTQTQSCFLRAWAADPSPPSRHTQESGPQPVSSDPGLQTLALLPHT